MRLLLFSLTGLLSLVAGAARADSGDLEIYFIDVEGGAATLIVTPAGESLLIDSGYPDNNGRDLKRLLSTIRHKAGLRQLDHAVVTHWHRDHYGNHAILAAHLHVGTFWDRGIPDSLAEDDQFVTRVADYRRASQNKSRTLEPGDRIPLRSGLTPVKLTVVTASRQVIPNSGEENPFASEHQPRDRDASDNAESISVLLEYGKFRFLCCGDLTWNVEGQLVTPRNPIGKVDVFMVTHHGLPTSNNPALVLAVDPVVAVMCNGPTKGGHADTLATLRRVKSLQGLYQLHRNIKLADEQQTPPTFIANTGRTADCQGRGIRLSVGPGGKNYTVRIEGHG